MPSKRLPLPLLGELVPGGFSYGGNYLVEFEPDSPWFEASLTITALALKEGIRTEYHTFRHLPNEIRSALGRQGLDVAKTEGEGILRILDTYALTTGLDNPETSSNYGAYYQTKSFDIMQWGSSMLEITKGGMAETEKRWLHLDDDTSVLTQYSDDKTFIEFLRTKGIPFTRARELVQFPSLLRGAVSEEVCVKFESLADGIVDFKTREEKGEIRHYVRVRTVRGGVCDSQWKHLHVRDNGEVKLDQTPVNAEILGPSRWLKGPRK